MNKLMVLQVSEDMLSELYDIIGQYPKAERCADCYEKLIEENLNGTTKLY